MNNPMRVTVWNEFRHEKQSDAKGEAVRRHYPDGIHHAIAERLRREDDMTVRTATLDEPEHGLTDATLADTDVLIWWAHAAHADVSEEVAERARQRVLEGMGLIALHSAHMSKLFRGLMGTSCRMKWREDDATQRLWVVAPGHPIVSGISDYIELPHTEMYGEHFDIPAPDELVFISWFKGGEVLRSGCCFQRGAGKIFYFQPGHETLPIYHDEQVQRVLVNAVRWAAPVPRPRPVRGNVKPAEKPDRP